MQMLFSKNDLFKQATEDVARELLGCYLCRETEEGLISGMIVETEAYLSINDPACHASRGRTGRNAAMFGAPGSAYIYLIYGIHYCFNVVARPEGIGEAVLIRAVEPVEGIDIMKRRRGINRKITDLASGPGKLCQAFAVDKSFNGHNLREKPLYLADSKEPGDRFRVVATPRIGISSAQDKLLRFAAEGNKFVSRR